LEDGMKNYLIVKPVLSRSPDCDSTTAYEPEKRRIKIFIESNI
jgi:hypothetical protein